MPEADVVESVEWRDAVVDAINGLALDVDLVTDPNTTEGLAFGQALDEYDLANANPADPAFAVAVRSVAEAFAEAHPEARVVEADQENIQGRVVEANGVNSDGGRVFRVQILKYGTSRNGNRYTEAVMRRDAHRYEGAKAYDHHRTPEELRSSTLAGLVGSYRNVEATTDGLYGDLHLLPSAVHTAEALDATIANQAAGRPPLVGISHDVMADFRPASNVNGRRVREAVAIKAVQSADVVADPSAGGKAIHAVESTTPEGDNTQESEVPVTKTDVLAAIRDASDDELAAVGLSRAGTTESVAPTTTTERVVESRVTESEYAKTSFLGRMLVKTKAEDAGLSHRLVESAVGDRFTESDVDSWIANYKDGLAAEERAGLAPRNSAVVMRESRDKAIEGLDKAMAGDYSYFRSIRQAWEAFSGYRGDRWGEDVNRTILRESIGYDSGTRATESLSTSSWAEALGDSITRRMVAMYRVPSLRSWEAIVSDRVPVNDFRTQRRVRIGGYGTLPVVAQGAPYQPLTSPGDEEATYALEKKGGTEDLTLEAIANDDLGAVTRIPRLLGLAAARTLHNFVWDFIKTNPTIYDSVTLFHAGSHVNTAALALSQTSLSTVRQKMRDQTGYGDTSNILSLVPRFLVVPNELEAKGFQLTRSAVAIPSTPDGPSDTPNIHQGMELIVLDYLTDADDWYVVADPNLCPTIELGFYQGREEPELFTQSDQSVGSMFNSDTLTYKIRHIYKGAVLDYRGFQQGTQ